MGRQQSAHYCRQLQPRLCDWQSQTLLRKQMDRGLIYWPNHLGETQLFSQEDEEEIISFYTTLK